jgi:1-deoxy-D-xylulose-5-phosphate reductoisomerase
MKRVALGGSTGSVGVAALDVVASHPDRLTVVALAAGGNVALLAEQVRAFRPSLVSVRDDRVRRLLMHDLGADCPEVMTGTEGVEAVASHPDSDIFLSAIVGAAGVRPTWRAVASGKTLALANKESLVTAGPAIMTEAASRGVAILPVDSEHSGVHQCLRAGHASELRRLILTASGGPFRKTPAEELSKVTPEQALRHPTWNMGRKISIDSATLMNKGLEVIEARWLFGLTAERIDVVVHPQSTVHSLVEFADGSVIAQLGVTDMRHPIRYALSWPDRWDAPGERLDLVRIGRLDFEEPDRGRFPCLDLAYAALREGGMAPAVLNAANEIAVAAFLDRRIGFLAIPDVIERTLGQCARPAGRSVEDFLSADADARRVAMGFVERRGVS